jgi:hypothetical protein
MPQIGNPFYEGLHGRRLLSPLNQQKLQGVLERMLDESEFFSPFGMRALSRYHKDHPYTFAVDRYVYSVNYEPAESSTSLFGGNSNWRGPIWVPVNALLIGHWTKVQYTGSPAP